MRPCHNKWLLVLRGHRCCCGATMWCGVVVLYVMWRVWGVRGICGVGGGGGGGRLVVAAVVAVVRSGECCFCFPPSKALYQQLSAI